jgi:outer membrane protein OmpA-like peptidoglycan-associated protein
VISNFSANPAQINCLDSSRLSWATSEAVDVTLQGSEVAASGEQLVSPRANTTYSLVAAGPGGRVERSANVDVNSGIDASLGVSPSEIRYRKIGDKVVEHGTATVTWSTTNADSVNIDPFGAVSASGNRSVQPAPRQTAVGPVNESVNYALTATNPCGGRETRSAALRITGSIEPMPEVVLASVFFPTDYPDQRNPGLGLLRSQRRGLTLLADGLKKYFEYDRNARLRLEAHADERASVQYNRALSGRRADIVKQFLVDQGIPSANIETATFGEEQNLTQAAVQELENQNPAKAPRPRLQNRRGDWLAHNRRVDVVLQPSGQRSTRYYPHTADDSGILWQVPKPAKSTVEKNQ